MKTLAACMVCVYMLLTVIAWCAGTGTHMTFLVITNIWVGIGIALNEVRK